MSQLLGGRQAPVQNVDFGPAFLKPEHGGAGCTTGSNDQDAGAFESVQAALERTNYSSGVSVEPVKFAVLRADHGIAGTDFGGVRVGVVEVGQDSFFVRHRDAYAVNGNFPHAGEEVPQGLRVQREI